jgi:casein kinase 1
MAPLPAAAPTLCTSRRESKFNELFRSSRSRQQRKTRLVPSAVGGGRFTLEEKLGAGAFGEVYRGIDILTKARVAIKLDVRTSPSGSNDNLAKEVDIMRLLQAGSTERRQGLPALLHAGQDARVPYLVMELLGKTLQERLEECGGRMQPHTVALIAEQAISRIEYLHSRGIVHSDIKPENFMFGVVPKVHHLYLIDFGLSKRYWVDGRHVPMKIHNGLQGTMRYSSINAHRGKEASRRDDLEAIGHVLLYLLRGSLPWSGMPAKNPDELNRMVGRKKLDFPVSELCAGFPEAFQSYLHITRKLGFHDRPDYEYLRELFRLVRNRGGPLEDHDFEWFQGQNMGDLEPLEEAPGSLPQPDDDAASGSMWRSLTDSRLWGRQLALICGTAALK